MVTGYGHVRFVMGNGRMSSVMLDGHVMFAM